MHYTLCNKHKLAKLRLEINIRMSMSKKNRNEISHCGKKRAKIQNTVAIQYNLYHKVGSASRTRDV